VIGVPGGIAIGRWLWDLFSRDTYAVSVRLLSSKSS